MSEKKLNGLMKLEILHKLMGLYIEGTGKKADFIKDGGYEIISFIKASLPLVGINESKEYPDNFIERFFTLMFESKNKGEQT